MAGHGTQGELVDEEVAAPDTDAGEQAEEAEEVEQAEEVEEPSDTDADDRAKADEPQHPGNASPSWNWPLSHAVALGLLLIELAFKLWTSDGLWPELPLIALLSLAAGSLVDFALSWAPDGVRRVVPTVALALAGTVASVEFFVQRAFNVFYDTRTVIAGASDATSSFGDMMVAIVLTPEGIARILVFLAPAILCAVASARLEQPTARSPRIAATAVVCQLAALLLMQGFPGIVGTYGDQYSFQAAVPAFGLATSVRKDVVRYVSGDDTDFVVEEEVVAVTKGEVSEGAVPAEEAEKVEVVYGPSVMDIDFEALAETTSGTWADLDRYVASLEPSMQNEMTGRFEGYNLILISAEALTAEAIRPDTTPTLYCMATRGIQFTDYYQFDTAGTTGGECANILGLLATQGGSSVKGTAAYNNWLTMGNMLNRKGYAGWAFHNNTYTYYGRDRTHVNFGYSNGYMGYGNGMEQWVEWQWPQSDLEMVQGTFDELYGMESPFDVYYMSVSGHSNYDPWDNMMTQRNWDVVKDLPYSERVRGYLAANVELDRAMEWLIGRLEELGIADRTVIAISADHFPYGLDNDGPLGSLPYLSELYGYEVTDYFQRDHNRLILWCGSLEDEDPIVVDTPTFSLDLLPTLANLFGCEWDSRLLPGRDVFSDAEPLVYNLSYDWRSDLGTYYAGSGQFVPNEGVEVPEGYVEATKAKVANRINYCRGVLTTDYWRHVFGEPDDVPAVNAAGREANAEMIDEAQSAYVPQAQVDEAEPEAESGPEPEPAE